MTSDATAQAGPSEGRDKGVQQRRASLAPQFIELGRAEGQQKENPTLLQSSQVIPGGRALQLLEYAIAAGKQLSAGGKGHLLVCLGL